MNREEDMAGYAQQGAPDTLAAISRLKLDLTILSVTSGVATFTLEGKDPGDKKHVSNKKITIPQGSKDVSIEFDLHDDSGNNLEYCQADPIWVSRTTTCPQIACNDSQIVDKRAQKKKLTVTDLNTDDVELGYTIIVEGDCGRVLVDPIIKNNP